MDISGLNDEQRLAVLHDVGHPAAIIAGAGSGKTKTLTTRIGYLIDDKQVGPNRICTLTFTNKAANEILERVGMSEQTNRPRIGTIHSLALSCIRKAPKGFGLNDKVTPLDDYDQKEMIKRLLDDKELNDIVNPYLLREKMGYHRARGLGFCVDYTPEAHQRALIAHGGYHALSGQELEVWAAYEREKTKNSVVDFDDMIHLVVRRGKSDDKWLSSLQRQFDYVLMDEAQDTNPVQWDFINMLLPPGNLNMLCVGDVSQCQPPGTMVKVVTIPATTRSAATCEYRAIENLRDGDLVTAWSKHVQITYSAGRGVRVASRPYAGPLVQIHTAVGRTECTPNHWNWVRFNKNTEGKYMVYLMFRKDLGFRVGLSVFKKATTGGKKSAYGLSTRMNQENAEKAWILGVFETRAEAEAWEEIYSLKYGIPESLFESAVCWNKTAELIKLVFSHANPEGGRRCLADHGLLEDYPITQREPDGAYRQSWRGYFKTATANIIPGIMDIPIEGKNKSTQITNVTTRHYRGPVYSLDVEKDHTYIADGLVVGNSIYGFNGAEPKILLGYVDGWRDAKPTLYKLERNHRSVPEVVALANKIQLYMSGTIPLKMDSFRGKQGEHGKIVLRQAGSPRDLAASISDEIVNRFKGIQYKDIAILLRAGSQVRDLETELVKNRIPYIIRGAMGLLQAEEVKDILAYLKMASNPHDFSALRRSVSVPKRGIGDAALDKVIALANDRYDGNLIETLRSPAFTKLAAYVGIIDELTERTHNPSDAIDYLLRAIKYDEYMKKKYAKHQDKIEVKQNNIGRLKEMIDALMAERDMTIDDVVFQLTMADQKDVAPEGKVIISTIHAAKGLEWKTVYVVGLVEGILPHKWATSEDEQEEERRIFYVACTRARDTLVLGVPAMIEYPGRAPQYVAPSRFLTELGICE